MDYNKRMNELRAEIARVRNEAKNEGYIELENGEFAKKFKIPVLELFSKSHSDDESYGHFYFVRQLYALNNEQLQTIRDSEPKERTDRNVWDYFYKVSEIASRSTCCTDKDRLFFESIEDDIFEEDIKMLEGFWLDKHEDLVLEFQFNKYATHGYMSLAMMDVEDYEKEKENQWNIYFKKIITEN